MNHIWPSVCQKAIKKLIVLKNYDPKCKTLIKEGLINQLVES